MNGPLRPANRSGGMGVVLGATILAAAVVVIGCDSQRFANRPAQPRETENPPAENTSSHASDDLQSEPTAMREERTDPALEPRMPASMPESAESTTATTASEDVDTTDNLSKEAASLESGGAADPHPVSSGETAKSEAGTSEAATSAPFRLLLPTTAGPLLVDLDILVGDQPLSAVFEQRIESILEQAGGADALTWNQLFGHIQANPQTFGPARVDSQQYRNLIQMYDRNRNKRPEPNEVAQFVFRDSVTSGPFRMSGSNFFRQVNRTQSPIFQALDRDGDHALDAEEIQLASQSLAQLDRNGDDRIDINEVVPPERNGNRNNDAWNGRHTSRWGDVAMDLGGFVDWSMVSYSLEEASRQGVFHDGPNAIAELDQNGDVFIDSDESRRLLEVPADVRMQIHFASGRTSEPSIDVNLRKVNGQTRIETSAAADRVRIVSDRFQLLAMASDLRRGPNAIPPEAFAALDGNKDGGLDPNEIPPEALREYSFEDLDQDKDGKLTPRELLEGMNPISPIWSVQVRARGAEAPDAIFTWLDSDQNGMLATREILACSERLQGIASAQGEVRASDIPDTFLIQFGRGDPQQDESLFAITPAPQQPTTWPRWAESMDFNRDGEISRNEFLGQGEQFESLDQNRDGFLSGSEIQ